jgi:hypothetical protein
VISDNIIRPESGGYFRIQEAIFAKHHVFPFFQANVIFEQQKNLSYYHVLSEKNFYFISYQFECFLIFCTIIFLCSPYFCVPVVVFCDQKKRRKCVPVTTAGKKSCLQQQSSFFFNLLKLKA